MCKKILKSFWFLFQLNKASSSISTTCLAGLPVRCQPEEHRPSHLQKSAQNLPRFHLRSWPWPGVVALPCCGGAERQRLEHVGPLPDAGVHQHRHGPRHRLNHLQSNAHLCQLPALCLRLWHSSAPIEHQQLNADRYYGESVSNSLPSSARMPLSRMATSRATNPHTNSVFRDTN